MKEMTVVAPHMVGKFKYIVAENNNGVRKPLEVYLREAQISVKPDTDEEEGECLSVSVKYVASYHGVWKWVDAKEIYDTEEEAKKHV